LLNWKLKKSNDGIPPLNIGGKISYDCQNTAKTFNTHFSTVTDKTFANKSMTINNT
jgi:hypothetical protein